MNLNQFRRQAAEGRYDLILLNAGVALIDGQDPSLENRIRLAASLCAGHIPAREIARRVHRACRCFWSERDPMTGEPY